MILKILFILLGIGLAVGLAVFLFLQFIGTPFSNGATAINNAMSDQYYYQEDKIIFTRMGNFFSIGSSDIDGADYDSFEVLAYGHARDKNYVYYMDERLENANPQTFSVLLEPYPDNLIKQPFAFYGKDGVSVYYLKNRIPNVDSDSFGLLWGDYSRDSTGVYFRGEFVTTIVIDVSEISGDHDKEYIQVDDDIFYRDGKIKAVNSRTFKILATGFSTDGHSVFRYHQQVAGADTDTFELIDEKYQKDKRTVYYQGVAIPDSDPGSYQILNAQFSKDENQAYSYGKIVRNIPAAALNQKRADRYSDDDTLAYLHYDENSKLIVESNLLKNLTYIYEIYNDEVYVSRHRIIGADIDSFEVIKDEHPYSKDSSNLYFQDKVIEKADRASFKIINDNFSRDDNHVYYQNRVIKDQDPASFIYSSDMYGEVLDSEFVELRHFEE